MKTGVVGPERAATAKAAAKGRGVRAQQLYDDEEDEDQQRRLVPTTRKPGGVGPDEPRRARWTGAESSSVREGREAVSLEQHQERVARGGDGGSSDGACCCSDGQNVRAQPERAPSCRGINFVVGPALASTSLSRSARSKKARAPTRMVASRALWLLLGYASLSVAFALPNGSTSRSASQPLEKRSTQQTQEQQQRYDPLEVHEWLLRGTGEPGGGRARSGLATDESLYDGLVPREARLSEISKRSPAKRSHKQQQQQVAQQALASVGRGAASQFFSRSTRASRRYDVPQI
ncbi:hypothetical protein QAD02_001886, partial [Eretmocerus hayati]